MLYIAQKLKTMTVQKLLGLLFEHLENGEIYAYDVYIDRVVIYDLDIINHFEIYFSDHLLTQYNKIFGYESW